MKLEAVQPNEYPRFTEIWEASVRATHEFLTEADIQYFKPRVREEFLPAVELVAARDRGGEPVGFVGVLNGKIEMLFIHPASRGNGVGRVLLRHAVEAMGAVTVDVNEQNPQAVGFYRRMGFVIEGRSERDGMGKPFPLLHMRLDEKPDRIRREGAMPT